MSKEKSSMPQSSAGLIRYYESSAESIKIKPEHVVVAGVFIIVLEIALKFLM